MPISTVPPTPSATVLRNRLIARGRFRPIFIFVKTVDLGSISLAADAAGVAQPSATQALADLESLLECSLLLRHSRGVVPTDVGRALLPLARQLLAVVDESATQVATLLGRAQTVVRVGTILAAIPGILGFALPSFSRSHPEIAIQVQEADSLRQATLISSGGIDLALCRRPGTIPDGWSFIPLLPDRFAIVGGPAHPLANRRDVAMADLLEAQWLVSPVSVSARKAFDELFSDARRPPDIHSVITAAAPLVKSLLVGESLLAVLPVSLVSHEIRRRELCEIAWNWTDGPADIGLLTPVVGSGSAADTLVSFLIRFTAESRLSPFA